MLDLQVCHDQVIKCKPAEIVWDYARICSQKIGNKTIILTQWSSIQLIFYCEIWYIDYTRKGN